MARSAAASDNKGRLCLDKPLESVLDVSHTGLRAGDPFSRHGRRQDMTGERSATVVRARRAAASRTLAFGPIAIAFTSNDLAAADWLGEFLEPWFTPTLETAEWRVHLSSSGDAYVHLNGRRPLAAAARPCFARDQQTLCLPAWTADGRVTVADTERSCFLIASQFEIDMVGDPATRTWRFTLMLVLREIAATRLRQTQLELHAAAVEAAGRAILISGPKGAGKTTLSIHLLRSAHCRLIANDRVFAGGATASFAVRGVPTAVKIHPATLVQFPELRRGLPRVRRLYLHTVAELGETLDNEDLPESARLALSPTQLARQLRVEPLGSAPLGAIVFPEIRTDVEGWFVERLAPKEVSAALWANLYGDQSGRRPPTLFEDFDGGPSVPSRSLADALSEAASGYRVVLGRNAYAEPDSANRLLQMLVGL
jgi:hypothetical protein